MLICPRLNLQLHYFFLIVLPKICIFIDKNLKIRETKSLRIINYVLMKKFLPIKYSFYLEFFLFYIYLTYFVICSIDETEERLRQRPSREEDIEAIQQLQHTVMEQDMLCKRLNDERKHYRKELVNREENFNKMFNASPNVGVLDPIGINKVSNFKLSCFRCVS